MLLRPFANPLIFCCTLSLLACGGGTMTDDRQTGAGGQQSSAGGSGDGSGGSSSGGNSAVMTGGVAANTGGEGAASGGDSNANSGGSNASGGDMASTGGMATDATGGTQLVDATPTAYRVTEMELVDPHLVVAVDITKTGNDTLLKPALNDDTDPKDGFIDLSLVSVFTPVDPSMAETPLDIVVANCTHPASSTSCMPKSASDVTATTAVNQDSGVCLEPMAGTLTNTTPNSPVAPCYLADGGTLTMTFAGVTMMLDDTQVSATYGGGSPPSELINGLMMGFLPKDRADATMVPADQPLIGGLILGNVLPASDLDKGPNNEDGYWVYLNFKAQPVPYTGL